MEVSCNCSLFTISVSSRKRSCPYLCIRYTIRQVNERRESNKLIRVLHSRLLMQQLPKNRFLIRKVVWSMLFYLCITIGCPSQWSADRFWPALAASPEKTPAPKVASIYHQKIQKRSYYHIIEWAYNSVLHLYLLTETVVVIFFPYAQTWSSRCAAWEVYCLFPSPPFCCCGGSGWFTKTAARLSEQIRDGRIYSNPIAVNQSITKCSVIHCILALTAK